MFSSIVVGTDGSDTAASAVGAAIAMANVTAAKANVASAYTEQRLPTGSERTPPLPAHLDIRPRQSAEAALRDAADQAMQAGVDMTTHARVGDPARVILDLAERQQADLIIVGSRGMTGAQRFLLGSVSNKISHHARCSVLIIRTS